MDVILLERIERLGQMGDVVKVKPGYARNYLLPQNKALRATKPNMERFESERSHLEAQNLEQRSEAEAVSGKIEGLRVILIRQAGESGQLYGSVNARDLAEAVTESGVKVNRSQIRMAKVIKVLGLHPVLVRLHPEVIVTIEANVARSQEEAELQAQTGRFVSAEDQRAAEDAAVEAALAEVEAEEVAAHDGESGDGDSGDGDSGGGDSDDGDPASDDAQAGSTA